MKKILIAYKKSTYARYLESEDARLQAVAQDNAKNDGTLIRAHKRHADSLLRVIDAIDKAGLEYDTKHRGDVDESADSYDLVVSVGGDGTVLDLSHFLTTTPLIGVNSDPERSVGYFCASDALGFAKELDTVLDSPDSAISLMRFQVLKNNTAVGFPILNDILFCHSNPAAVSSYKISAANVRGEVQKSSGIWISTPAGSTAAIRSAGGYVQPLTGRNIQYLVREPYLSFNRSYQLLKGFLKTSDAFEIISRMPSGCVYLDGPHQRIDLTVDDVISLSLEAPELRIYGVRGETRI